MKFLLLMLYLRSSCVTVTGTLRWRYINITAWKFTEEQSRYWGIIQQGDNSPVALRREEVAAAFTDAARDCQHLSCLQTASLLSVLQEEICNWEKIKKWISRDTETKEEKFCILQQLAGVSPGCKVPRTPAKQGREPLPLGCLQKRVLLAQLPPHIYPIKSHGLSFACQKLQCSRLTQTYFEFFTFSYEACLES